MWVHEIELAYNQIGDVNIVQVITNSISGTLCEMWYSPGIPEFIDPRLLTSNALIASGIFVAVYFSDLFRLDFGRLVRYNL